MEDSPIDNQKLWSTIYKLYDRDNSGFADEGDTIAAMVTMGRKPEEARRMARKVALWNDQSMARRSWKIINKSNG